MLQSPFEIPQNLKDQQPDEQPDDLGEEFPPQPPSPSSSTSSSSSTSASSSSSSSSDEGSHSSNAIPPSPPQQGANVEPSDIANNEAAGSSQAHPAPMAAEARQQHAGLTVYSGQAATQFRIKHKPQSQDLFALCTLHPGGCQRTRTVRSHRKKRGRPLGELAAWVLAGSEFASKAEHMAFAPDFASRRTARTDLRNNGVLLNLFTVLEAASAPGEDSEPAEV